ncbi:MAG: acylphosphatase [Bacteroidota bacterium]
MNKDQTELGHYNIRGQGLMQGVYFRKSCPEKAQSLGIKGLVKNQADGSVYLEAEGTKDALAQLLAWCQQGPTKAQVTKVELQEGPGQSFSDFIIQY